MHSFNMFCSRISHCYLTRCTVIIYCFVLPSINVNVIKKCFVIIVENETFLPITLLVVQCQFPDSPPGLGFCKLSVHCPDYCCVVCRYVNDKFTRVG